MAFHDDLKEKAEETKRRIKEASMAGHGHAKRIASNISELIAQEVHPRIVGTFKWFKTHINKILSTFYRVSLLVIVFMALSTLNKSCSNSSDSSFTLVGRDADGKLVIGQTKVCLLYTSPSPRD